ALYLRDAVAEVEHSEDGYAPGTTLEWDRLRLLKLASLMDLHQLPDCAIELLLLARERGHCAAEEVERFCDLLVPDARERIFPDCGLVGGPEATYASYLE